MSDDLNFVMQARREKLDALEAARHRAVRVLASIRTHDAASALSRRSPRAWSEGEVVRVAGRIVAWRAHGKTDFAHLADDSGHASSSTSARMTWARRRFAWLDLLDLGDVIGVSGPLFRTRTGEDDRARGIGDAARQVAAPAAVREGRTSSTA